MLVFSTPTPPEDVIIYKFVWSDKKTLSLLPSSLPRAVACECHLTVAHVAIVLVLGLAGCVVESSLAKKKKEKKSKASKSTLGMKTRKAQATV